MKGKPMLEVKLKKVVGCGTPVTMTKVVARTPVEVNRIISAKKPLTKAMDMVRRELGDGHGFFPVSDVYEVS